MPSQGCAALWHVLSAGPSAPLGLECSPEFTSLCVSEKTPLCIFKLRIFEVSPTSGCAFFDLAMTDMRAGSEATSLLYSQGTLFPSPAHLSQTKIIILLSFLPPSSVAKREQSVINRKNVLDQMNERSAKPLTICRGGRKWNEGSKIEQLQFDFQVCKLY